MRFATKYEYKMKKSEIQVFIKIESKNGRGIERISEFNGNFVPENQCEVLFGSNTPFRIENKEVSGNVVWLNMTEL